MDKYLGKRLDGRYIIKELIGVGGMAYVYKAYDCIDDRTVALKILKDEFLENEEFTRRFKNESKAIAILSHPNIVKVYDVSFGEQLQYIVMEYIDGITLKEYIDQQDIKWKEAVHFTVQILRALQHAHDKGVVHRDIKPQNIMMLPDGTIKVMDFGIARLSRNDVRATVNTDKAIGSVHYISPEQARGDQTDEKSDIYSVGVMLYEMLTGRLPFDSDSAVSVAIMQLQSEPTAPHEINPDIPEGLEQITMKAMQKDPAKRYRTAAEMLYDIDEFKRNPSIHFEYKYMVDEPTRFVDSVAAAEPVAEPLADEEEEEEEEERKAPIFAILASVAGAVVVAAIIFVCAVMLPRIMQGNATDNVKVEKFFGLDYATEIMTNATFKENYTFEFETEYNSTYPKGTVIKQSPAPGNTIKKKGTVKLTISDGPRMQTVDDVTGLDPEEAARILRDVSGFQIVIAQQSSSEVRAGFVIRTVPAANDSAEYGSKITIFVSTGEAKPDPVEMVDVMSSSVGSITEDVARNMLIDAGFTVGKTVYVNGPYVGGYVLAQSTTPGQLYDPGTEVVLTVTSGYQDCSDITVSLPSNATVDLRVFIDGVFNEELSLLYNNIHHSKRQVKYTTTEQKDTYTVAVQISAAGADRWQDYYIFLVDGVYGTSSVLERYEYTANPTTTTPTTPTTPTNPEESSNPGEESSLPEESGGDESSAVTEEPSTEELPSTGNGEVLA